MLVVGRQHAVGALAPGREHRVHQPARMRVTARRGPASTRPNNSARCATKRRNTALTMPLARRLADDAAGIHGEVHLRLGRAARILDLVRGGHQQRRELRRQVPRTAGSAAARARARAAGTSAGYPARWPAPPRDRCAHARLRARRPTNAPGAPRCAPRAPPAPAFRHPAHGSAAWLAAVRAGGIFDCSCAEPQAVEPHGVGEIARGDGPLAGALQLAHREHALAAGHAQAVFGKAEHACRARLRRRA